MKTFHLPAFLVALILCVALEKTFAKQIDVVDSIAELNPTRFTKESKCIDIPYWYKFKFVGGGCDKFDDSNLFWCIDKGKIPEVGAYIIIADAYSSDIFEGWLEKGDYFEFHTKSYFYGYIIVKILDDKDKVVQVIIFLANCKRVFHLGDQFGSIKVVGWENENQGKVIDLYEDVDPVDVTTQAPIRAPSKAPSQHPTHYPTHCKCLGYPNVYRFKFVKGTCDDSKIYDKISSKKFKCFQKEIIDNWKYVKIVVCDRKYPDNKLFEGRVSANEQFNVFSDYYFYGYLVIKIFVKESYRSNWKLVQIIKFDASCDTTLYSGDRFGSIEVIGWQNDKQGKVIEGSDNHTCYKD